ncbi:restriction endonuclease subunit S [Bacteroides fragilis]|uniref:restriction endonuclease subunit S n=1 Tax=Bacteroides fragilis TaxID=817 RepID=UPI00356B24E7
MADNNENKVLNVPHLRFPEFSGEWKKHSLGEIGETIIGLTYKPSDVVDNNGIIVFRSSNIKNGMIDYSDLVRVNKHIKDKIITKENDILVCARNGSQRLIGKNAIIKQEDANNTFGAFMMVYRANDNPFILPLLSTKKYFSQVGENLGARINQITTSDFNGFEFYFPENHAERTKIAELFRLLDERIATQNKIIEKLQSLIKGLIDDIITLKCGQLVAFETLYSKAGEGGTPTTSNTEFYDNGSIPFIKIDDLSNKYLSANKDYITELGLKKSSAWLIPTHSIIYSNGATIGAISINKYPVCTKQGILGIVPNTNIDVEFLYYFMQSSYFQKEVERVVTEGTMKTAYLKDINHIKCPIPDLDRQKEISHLLSVLSLKEDVERQLLQKYQIQKQYLLRKMFI